MIKIHDKFEMGDRARILKYKNIFTKGYTQRSSEEVSGIKKVRNPVLWTYVLKYLNNEEMLERFMKKNCKDK